MKIKYLALGLDGNKALGLASCFITISAARLVLYFSYSTRGNALTYTVYIQVAAKKCPETLGQHLWRSEVK